MSSAMSAAKAATDHMHDWYVLCIDLELKLSGVSEMIVEFE